MSWDFFISHASEDKVIARDIAFALAKRGKRVWFDEFRLKAGDSLRRSIDLGLANSRFGIVVLSPRFFEKEWPNRELDALMARDDDSEKVIIPIWHSVDRKDVMQFSPMLADKLAIDGTLPSDEIVRLILAASHYDITFEITERLSVLVLGATGSGKTTLCQQLWQQPLMYTIEDGRIEHNQALIRDQNGHDVRIEYHMISCGDRSDEDFIRSVSRLAIAVDKILWVSTADSRGHFELHLLAKIAESDPARIVIALNRIDLVGARSWSDRLWNEDANRPTLEQQEKIDHFSEHYAQALNLPRSAIVPTSADRSYGINRLREVLLTQTV